MCCKCSILIPQEECTKEVSYVIYLTLKKILCTCLLVDVTRVHVKSMFFFRV